LAHMGETEQAIPLLDKAIGLNPFDPSSRKMLIVRLIETKQYPRAQTELEQFVEYFPQDDRMRQALARAKATSPQP